jgi:hypothetical protein
MSDLSLTLAQLSVLVNLQMPLAHQLGRQDSSIRPTDSIRIRITIESG